MATYKKKTLRKMLPTRMLEPDSQALHKRKNTKTPNVKVELKNETGETLSTVELTPNMFSTGSRGYNAVEIRSKSKK